MFPNRREEIQHALTNITAGVYAYGFERPSAIQQRAIMPVIQGSYQSSSLLPERPQVNLRLKVVM